MQHRMSGLLVLALLASIPHRLTAAFSGSTSNRKTAAPQTSERPIARLRAQQATDDAAINKAVAKRNRKAAKRLADARRGGAPAAYHVTPPPANVP